MKTVRIQNWVRLILLLCGVGLIAVLFVPMWRIDLQAPQYPEGLMLLIYPNKLAGNVDIINGLNHYIGMKTLHSEDFMEFKVLQYIIGFFALFFFIVVITGKRKLLNILFIVFVCFGILAMYDFWRWEYNYGHNLNPDAAIIVPGMAYQPPLIGFKQLLNFGAYSMPDIGGWIFISVGALLLLAVVAAWRKNKGQLIKFNTAAIALLLTISLASCNAVPEPIKAGVDNCYFCKMTVTDNRFGAELVTTKGKIYKFDDVYCILSYLKTKDVETANIKDIYLTDFCNTHQLINVNHLSLLKSEDLRSPMGGNIAAFDNKDSLAKTQQRFAGTIVNWNELIKE
ncbi:nitrous oxide reductase accessory protein NosL [Ferruginibacter sp. SUN106]|uniref:nitrous oxide reductase accessory protein NosL n=1 Tax=Ferruginibacter sp. SUN106 TaxID=2978348 RepID=UPI003D36D773